MTKLGFARPVGTGREIVWPPCGILHRRFLSISVLAGCPFEGQVLLKEDPGSTDMDNRARRPGKGVTGLGEHVGDHSRDAMSGFPFLHVRLLYSVMCFLGVQAGRHIDNTQASKKWRPCITSRDGTLRPPILGDLDSEDPGPVPGVRPREPRGPTGADA